MDYDKVKKYYLDIVDDIHEEGIFSSSLDFFKAGFTLTDGDRFKEFRLEYSPWITTLCGWFDDPEVEWIYLLQGSQTAKTTFMMGLLLYISKFIKGSLPVTWIMNTEEESNLFVSERLKLFLDAGGLETSKRWRRQAFRVFNAFLKVGYASTKNSMRSKPARFVFGDECSLWKETISYLKKRTRTFVNKRKGVFGTVPPETENHHSWKEATVGNVYCIFVECPDCGGRQRLSFYNLVWYTKESNEIWDFKRVKETTRYKCAHCGSLWEEHQKLDIIQDGKAVCVDSQTWEETEEKNSTSRTLQLSAMYSIFTSWGQLACDFIEAKAGGWESLKVFITDELSEIPKQKGRKLKRQDLEKYKSLGRKSGVIEGYDCYTAGIDVQRTGLLYYVILGFRRGSLLSGHVLNYGKVLWKTPQGVTNWLPLLDEFSAFRHFLYRCPIDATDGEEQQNIVDFCTWAGPPFIPLIDSGSEQIAKTKFKNCNIRKTGGKYITSKMFSINSAMVKNELAAAFQRDSGGVGAWSFPNDTSDDFFIHLGNERRTTRKRGTLTVSAWEPRYQGAPQHYFSALVYAFSGIEEIRHLLQDRAKPTNAQEFRQKRSFRKVGL